MSDHVHEWKITRWSGYNEESLAYCIVEGCDAELFGDEAERRFNVTERLSAEDARILRDWLKPNPERFNMHRVLYEYAAALEGEDE